MKGNLLLFVMAGLVLFGGCSERLEFTPLLTQNYSDVGMNMLSSGEKSVKTINFTDQIENQMIFKDGNYYFLPQEVLECADITEIDFSKFILPIDSPTDKSLLSKTGSILPEDLDATYFLRLFLSYIDEDSILFTSDNAKKAFVNKMNVVLKMFDNANGIAIFNKGFNDLYNYAGRAFQKEADMDLLHEFLGLSEWVYETGNLFVPPVYVQGWVDCFKRCASTFMPIPLQIGAALAVGTCLLTGNPISCIATGVLGIYGAAAVLSCALQCAIIHE